MADVHHHGSTVITEDREGPAAALMAVLAVLLIGFLVWFFAFSGVVFDRGNSGGGRTDVTNIENNTNNQNPGSSSVPSANPT